MARSPNPNVNDMSRWHLPDCPVPDVRIGDDGVPCCRNCQASPQLDELVRQQAALPAPWALPPDPALTPGSQNFWWPPSVPWSQSPPDALTSSIPIPAPRSPHPDPDAVKDTSTVYTNRLAPNEFRLLCLYPPETAEAPIHVTLETHNDDDCPEYETVSYTWADEAGDATLCSPIYVDRHWDLLFQTPNCASMLRFLRPKRGVRTLWVDAVCINQRDVHEREAQVRKMATIYRNALRTIVYLGDHMIKPAAAKHRPRRHGLNEIGSDALRRILGHRYFRRVWVIQELLYSQSVLFPIGDTDYLTGPSPITLDNWDWESVGPSWARHICDSPSFATTGPWRAMRTTRESESTDPRDKVFGILGLLRDAHLTPNYSLSLSQTIIGSFAHFLLNNGAYAILLNVNNTAAPQSRYPSWIPDWSSVNGPPWRESQLDITLDKTQTLTRHLQDLVRSNPSARERIMTVIHKGRYALTLPNRVVVPNGPVAPDTGWKVGASVNASTASLSVNLVHIVRLTSPPRLHPRVHDNLWVVQTGEVAQLYIYTSENLALDDLQVGDGSVHLFLLETGPGKDDICLFMQDVGGEQGYICLRCYECKAVVVLYSPEEERKEAERANPEDLIRVEMEHAGFESYTMCDRSRFGDLALFGTSLSTVRQFLHLPTHHGMGRIETSAPTAFKLPFRLSVNPSTLSGPDPDFPADVLALFQGLLNEKRDATPTFLDAFSRVLRRKEFALHYPQILSGQGAQETGVLVQFLFERAEWEELQNLVYQRAIQKQKDSGAIIIVMEETVARVSWEIQALKKRLRGDPLYWILESFSDYVDVTGEDETQLLTREPRWKDQFLFRHPWGRRCIQDVGLDGSVRRVTIL